MDAFLSNKHNQSCSKSPHQNGVTLNKEILPVARKTYVPHISPARAVIICHMHKSNRCFCTSLGMLGEINFQSKFCLKVSIFLFENCLGTKRRSKVTGTYRKCGAGQQKSSVINLIQKHLAMWLFIDTMRPSTKNFQIS